MWNFLVLSRKEFDVKEATMSFKGFASNFCVLKRVIEKMGHSCVWSFTNSLEELRIVDSSR